MPNFIDLTGLRFGRLLVISRINDHKTSKIRWLCKCNCGNESVVFSANLRKGSTISCGCARKETFHPPITHGATLHANGDQRKYPRSYKIWNRMKQRCRDKNDPSYRHYGGRGIYVCERWSNYANFKADMGEPNRNESIDRIDNNGPYSPENCRWATKKEQARNTSKNVFITFGGETKCIGEWAEITGIHLRALHARIKSGWGVERAFTEPLRRWQYNAGVGHR